MAGHLPPRRKGHQVVARSVHDKGRHLELAEPPGTSKPSRHHADAPRRTTVGHPRSSEAAAARTHPSPAQRRVSGRIGGTRAEVATSTRRSTRSRWSRASDRARCDPPMEQPTTVARPMSRNSRRATASSAMPSIEIGHVRLSLRPAPTGSNRPPRQLIRKVADDVGKVVDVDAQARNRVGGRSFPVDFVIESMSLTRGLGARSSLSSPPAWPGQPAARAESNIGSDQKSDSQYFLCIHERRIREATCSRSLGAGVRSYRDALTKEWA